MFRRTLPGTSSISLAVSVRGASARIRGMGGVLVLVGMLSGIVGCGPGEAGEEPGVGGEVRVETEALGSPGASEASEGRTDPDITGGLRAEPGPDTPSPTSTEAPEGGLEDWVEEMRQRLEVIELDPRASYPDVLRLYNTHHAAIERYYGSGGELTGTDQPALESAIQQQDSAFHELLELTRTTDYIERTHLLHAIRNVRLAMEATLDRARAAGVPLEPR